MENIKNLPVIPHKAITEKSDDFAVRFFVTEFQAAEVFENYSVEVSYCETDGRMASFQEAFEVLQPAPVDGLEIPGVTSLVRVLWMDRLSPSHLKAESASYWLLYNGQLFRPGRNKAREPYRFSLVGSIRNSFRAPKYYESEAQEPQRVGKATEKKIKAWADYLNAEEEAMREYVQASRDRKEAFLKKLDDLGLTCYISDNTVTIYNGCLKLTVQMSETSIFLRSVEFNDRISIGIYGEDKLDFLLNREFPVILRKDGQHEQA